MINDTPLAAFGQIKLAGDHGEKNMKNFMKGITAAALLGSLGACQFQYASVKEDNKTVYGLRGTKGVHTEQKASVDADKNESYESRTIGLGLDGTYNDVNQDIFGVRGSGKLQTSIDRNSATADVETLMKHRDFINGLKGDLADAKKSAVEYKALADKNPEYVANAEKAEKLAAETQKLLDRANSVIKGYQVINGQSAEAVEETKKE